MTVDSPRSDNHGTDQRRADQPSIGQIERTRTMRVPRTRGAVSGLLLILLGAWGALVPFIGPYFDFSYGTDQTWVWSAARGWLEVLPGAVAAFGGLLVMVSNNRVRGSFGAWLAILAGAWFVIGQSLAPVWHLGDLGKPLSSRQSGQAAAQLGYFYGLGAVVILLAAFALGRLAVVGVRDLLAAEKDEARAAEAVRQAELDRQHALDQEVRLRREADERAASERAAAEERAASERTAAEQRAASERSAAEQRAAADQSAATDRASSERAHAEHASTDAHGEARATQAQAEAPATEREGRYNPNDGRSDGFGHSPAHSADGSTEPGQANPYDPRN